MVVCGRPSSFVGGRLRFLGGRGGGAVIGGRWHSWAITRAVVVKSVVGGGDKHGWWWWEGEMVVVGRRDGGGGKKVIAKQTLFVCLGRSLTCSNLHMRSSHV